MKEIIYRSIIMFIVGLIIGLLLSSCQFTRDITNQHYTYSRKCGGGRCNVQKDKTPRRPEWRSMY